MASCWQPPCSCSRVPWGPLRCSSWALAWWSRLWALGLFSLRITSSARRSATPPGKKWLPATPGAMQVLTPQSILTYPPIVAALLRRRIRRTQAPSARRWATPSCGRSHFRHNFLELAWVSYQLSKWRFFESLHDHIGPPLTPASIVVNKFWVCSPISCQRTSFWCMFYDSHPTIHHSNAGGHLRSVIELGTPTLPSHKGDLKPKGLTRIPRCLF